MAKIMVVEDESIVGMDIQNRLKGLGYVVSAVVSSGEEAIKKAEEAHPCLVLMDIGLKGDMDGVEAAEQIRDRLDIPVVYLTALSDESTLQRAKVTEPYGYIFKPFEERELHTTIEMALYRHKMEKKLKESEERFRKLSRAVEQSPASVVITDTEGNIEYVNPKFTQITGYTPEEVIGQNPRILKSGEQPPEVYKRLWETIASGGEWRGEFHNKKKNGELYWEFASISPIKNSEGAITHFLAVKEDITERKRAEEERERLTLDLQEALDEIMTLNQASNALAGTLELEKILKTLVDSVRENFEIDGVKLYLLNENKTTLECKISAGTTAEDDSRPFIPIDGEIFSKTFKNREGNLQLSKVYEGMTSAAIPLTVGEDVLGLVAFENNGKPITNINLLYTILNQASLAIANSQRYEKVSDEKLRMEHEVSIARDIQMDLLSKRHPDISGFSLGAFCLPSEEVSGDFYDFIEIDEEHIGIAIGDVVGKGIPASLLMVMVITILRVEALHSLSPVEVLTEVNSHILKMSGTGTYITIFYGVLDIVDRILRYTSAGHDYPLFYSAKCREVRGLSAGGLAVGVFEDMQLEEGSVRIEEGDLLLGYTDGLVDALDKLGEGYNLDRLSGLIEEKGHLTVEGLVHRIKCELGPSTEDVSREDDITVVALGREPA